MVGGDEKPTAQESAKKPKSQATGGGEKGQGKNSRGDKAAKSNKNKGRGGKKKQSGPDQAKSDKAAAGQSAADKPKSKKPNKAKKNKPKKAQPKAPWDISQFPVPEVEGKTRFHDLALENDLMHAIADCGFEYCSPIQAQSLPYALTGRDVVGKAQTGTGKTAAFLTAIIDDLLKHQLTEERFAGEARALVIAPTRELVMQIADDAKALCKHTELEIHTLVGGMDYTKQQRRLHDKLVDILVATPGRLLDFCRNKDVYLDQLEILVIDEADRMLDMGFIPQVRQIVRQTPKREDRQTLFFSATFTDEVHRLVEQWTDNPVTVEIAPESVATDTVEQHVYLASTDEKYTLLYNLIQDAEVESMIVFANRRDECRRLEDKLQRHGIRVGLLSGEIAQNKRVSTLKAFKEGDLKVLVATDVAGRGIHIDGISHVVNFTLPEEPEDYVHRIGRTGRAGKSGTSISFACEDDAFRLMPIEELLGRPLRCEQPPQDLLLETPPMAPAKPKPRGEQNQRRGGRGRGGQRSGQRRS
ncbi:ATP-dependent RNA helicase RhlB [Gilvimarinus sp. DA14]|uniref:ATP-dependent RNA helicase RhlB n=1 Tax=Gilvimarinus sp. DA14 TaxID=2956798 RepID=UPI0020B7F571|nr:ATP-dependent RNA helicase RhlB [Gilvimarinus sp. DA14]UTF61931.1 ATP-dependent RNA helicase RhlB [Gilvimarinus sp. DA14]